MSTTCYRCIEVKQNDGSWRACGEFSDNYHGFDRWRNEDFYERGFPEGSKYHDMDMKSDDGRDYTWGHSYMLLSELEAWADRVKEDAMSYLFGNLHTGISHRIDRRLKDIETKLGIDPKLPGKEHKQKSEDEYYTEFDPMDNFNQFKDLYEEVMEEYDGLNSQIIKAYTIATQAEDDRWIDSDKIRIVYYFA